MKITLTGGSINIFKKFVEWPVCGCQVHYSPRPVEEQGIPVFQTRQERLFGRSCPVVLR